MHVVGREGMGKGKIMRQVSLYHLSLSNCGCGCGLRLTHTNQSGFVLFPLVYATFFAFLSFPTSIIIHLAQALRAIHTHRQREAAKRGF